MKNILVPTDFSPASKHGINYALEIARLTGANVHVVNFIPPANEILSSVNLLSENLEQMKSLKKIYNDQGVTIYTKIVLECVQDGVKKMDVDHNFDMVVIGIDDSTTIGDSFCKDQGLDELATPVVVCDETYDGVTKLEQMMASNDPDHLDMESVKSALSVLNLNAVTSTGQYQELN